MARYTDYRQYDDKPFGYGEFELDDGSVYVLDDPERARSVLGLLGQSSTASDVANESQNIAERGSADRQGEKLTNRQQLENAAAKLAGVSEPNEPNRAFRGIDTGPSPMRRAVAGPGGGEDDLDARQRELSAELDAPEEETEPDPAPARVEPSPEEVQDAEVARRYQSAAALVPSRRGGTDPRALGPGVAVDKNFSRKGGLAPEEYNRQAGDRAQVHTAGDQLIARQYQENQDRAAIQAEQLRSQAIGMKQQNDAKELELQKRGQKYQEDRTWLEQDVDKWYDKKASPDGGLREKRGALGNIASAVAQFMGAYAAVVSGTPNFANQILNRKMDAHVEAQLEDFRRGRAKRDGQMQRMADRGMSIDQMRAALKVQQELALRKEVEAASLEEGTRESKQAAERLLMDRQESFVNKENEYRTAALGEQTVSGEYVRPTAGKELSPLERLLETNKLLEAQNEGVRQARGGAPAERAEDMAFKREERQHQRDTERNKVTEDQAKAEAAWNTIEAYGDAAGIKKDPKTGERVADQSVFSRDTLIAPGQREAVNDLTGQGKPIEAARRSAVEGLGRLQSGGVISPAEEENFKRLLGDASATRAQLATNLNALRTLIQSRRSQTNQQQSTAAPSSWQSGNRR